MTSASYNSSTGQVEVIIPNSTINGYSNTVFQFQTANTISVPNAGGLVDLDVQAPSQMQITGYQSTLIDDNYTISSGEFTSYSDSWYVSTRNAGVEIQQAQTANIENMMMGQSTNAVMLDILTYLIALYTWATTHTHSGVQTGGGISGVTVQVVPDDSDIVTDQTYIEGNENLAITGTYEPKS
jgi:hypothetical protein